ncbi:hypothetical protein [Altericroceibacterium spongiae]|uniref:hypothetical protein n=1 Tax=Altericroceibacterium spongiae TaxID=2320269 RepID=UPI001601C26D|nr:hypothetical protein [Altericroceibacterium spongiae]
MIERLIAGVIGQASARVMVAIYQLAIIPLMIAGWGADLYGEWLILTGLATYLAISGQGLVTAGAMQIIHKLAKGEEEDAKETLAASFTAILLAGFFFLLFSLCLFAGFGLGRFLSVTHINGEELLALLLLVSMQITSLSCRSLFMAIVHATGDYARPALLSSAVRGGEFAGSATIVLLGGGPLGVAGWITIMAVIDCVAQWHFARSHSSRLRLSLTFRLRSARNGLVTPTLGNIATALAINGIGIQGFRLITAATLGSAAVAVLAIYTALLRFTEHCTNMVLPVLQLELARRGVESQNRKTVLSAVGLATLAGLVIALSWLVILFLVGAWLCPWLTGGQVIFDPHLLLILGAGTLFVQAGRPSLTCLTARNHTGAAGLLLLAGWSLALLVAVPLVMVAGLHGVVLALTFGEAVSFLVCLHMAAHYLAIGPWLYLVALLHPRTGASLVARQWGCWRQRPRA